MTAAVKRGSELGVREEEIDAACYCTVGGVVHLTIQGQVAPRKVRCGGMQLAGGDRPLPGQGNAI